MKTKILYLLVIILFTNFSFSQCKLYNHPDENYEEADFEPLSDINVLTKGLDLSNGSKLTNWVKAEENNIKFIYIKKSNGDYEFLGEDGVPPRINICHLERFKKNVEESYKNGMLIGAFHWYQNNISGIKQADEFLREYDKEKITLPPMLDLEDTTTPILDINKEILAWIQKVYDELKIPILIYIGTAKSEYWTFLDKNLTHETKTFLRTNTKLCVVSEEDTDNNYPPKADYLGWNQWEFWQYQLDKYSNFNSRLIDLYVYNGSYDSLKSKYAKK